MSRVWFYECRFFNLILITLKVFISALCFFKSIWALRLGFVLNLSLFKATLWFGLKAYFLNLISGQRPKDSIEVFGNGSRQHRQEDRSASEAARQDEGGARDLRSHHQSHRVRHEGEGYYHRGHQRQDEHCRRQVCSQLLGVIGLSLFEAF